METRIILSETSTSCWQQGGRRDKLRPHASSRCLFSRCSADSPENKRLRLNNRERVTPPRPSEPRHKPGQGFETDQKGSVTETGPKHRASERTSDRNRAGSGPVLSLHINQSQLHSAAHRPASGPGGVLDPARVKPSFRAAGVMDLGH